uniref:Secreted protein n=1 Tax=Ixodes ricinus TaxID=34613 RepID=A0A6B0U357_IXORI
MHHSLLLLCSARAEVTIALQKNPVGNCCHFPAQTYMEQDPLVTGLEKKNSFHCSPVFHRMGCTVTESDVFIQIDHFAHFCGL